MWFYYLGSHQNLASGRDALAETSAFLLDAGLAKTALFTWTYPNSELPMFCKFCKPLLNPVLLRTPGNSFSPNDQPFTKEESQRLSALFRELSQTTNEVQLKTES